MKIKVGKKYKTRNGHIVFIHCLSKKSLFIGEMGDSGEVGMWLPDGKSSSWVRGAECWDLVSEVKEKLKVTFCMDMPEEFKMLTADEIETELRGIFTNCFGKIRILNPMGERGFTCDDIIVSGMTEE